LEEEGPDPLNPCSGSTPPELWGVPCYGDHTLKLVPDLGNDGWLCNAKWEDNGCRGGYSTKAQTRGMPRYRCETCDYDLCEKCHDARAKVIAARNPEPLDVDREGKKFRPLTRNRMAYFFVFDSSDMESYKEALAQEKALNDYLTMKEIRVQPVVFFVGTKIDVDPNSVNFKNVQYSATSKSIRDSVRYKEVSSTKFEGVRRLFREAVMSIRSKQTLWLLEHGIRNREDEQKDEACCLQ